MVKVRVVKPIDALSWRLSEAAHDDVRRLTRSLVVTLRRRYPNEVERRVVASRIMQELAENNSLASEINIA